jgi:hypothetical protein
MKCLNGLTIYQKVWRPAAKLGMMTIKEGSISMTPIESIYEIQSAILDLQRYLHSKDAVVSKRAQMKYKQWVDRFFRENKSFIKPEQRQFCSHDPAYFFELMKTAIEYYEMNS